MMTELIQAIFDQFSLKIVYVAAAWFAIFGYGAHLITVMLLTRLPMKELLQPVARLHAMTVVASLLLSPVCFVVSSGLMHVLFPEFVPAQGVFVWFSLNMMLFSAYFLCSVFVSTTCKRFQSLLIVVDGVVGFLGYFVLKGLNLL